MGDEDHGDYLSLSVLSQFAYFHSLLKPLYSFFFFFFNRHHFTDTNLRGRIGYVMCRALCRMTVGGSVFKNY